MHWAVLMLICSVLITLAQMYVKYEGAGFKAWLVYSLILVSTVSWLLPWVYEKSESFYQPYMLGVGTVAFFGWAASVFIFGEHIQCLHYVAIVLLLCGAILIVR